MRLKEWIEVEKISITKMAREIAVGREAIHKYIKGTRIPPLCIALKIVNFTHGHVRYMDMINAAKDSGSKDALEVVGLLRKWKKNGMKLIL